MSLENEPDVLDGRPARKMGLAELVATRNAKGNCGYCNKALGCYVGWVPEGKICQSCWDLKEGPHTDPPVAPTGQKKDTGKPPLDLIDPYFIEDVSRVLDKGAIKYGLNNYQKGMAIGKAMAGVLRHCFAVLRGELLDPETGLPHVAHATCGLMFVHYFLRTGKVQPDDRFAK